MLYLGVFGQLGWGIGVLIKDNIKRSYSPPRPPQTFAAQSTVQHSYKSVGEGESLNHKQL